MKQFTGLVLLIFLCSSIKGQLYINGEVFVQKNGLLFSEDTVQLASLALVTTDGIIQSYKSISTNGRVINTGTTGFIISPIPSDENISFDIGTTTNSKIQIEHSTGTAITFQIAVRDGIYKDPETNSDIITSNVVGKTWIINPLSHTSNCNVTAGWNSSDELVSFNNTVCAISSWTTSVSSHWSVIGSFSSATNTGAIPTYTMSAMLGNLAPNNTYLGVGGNGSILPITSLSFIAKVLKQDVYTSWETFGANNSTSFLLERSFDGLVFNTVAIVTAKHNNMPTDKYTYTDAKAFITGNCRQLYYRLKQIDKNGLFSFSEIRKVTLDDIYGSTFIVYPNPAKGIVYLKILSDKNGPANIAIYSEEGKQVISKSTMLYEGLQSIPLPITPLAKGFYQIKITCTSGSLPTQKLIIQ